MICVFLSVYSSLTVICLQNKKKQMIADAAVDSMKQHMLELCRSDTLSRAREQHDRDLVIIKEQHEAALLALQQELDSTSQALNEQVCGSSCHRMKQWKQIKMLCHIYVYGEVLFVASRLILVRGYKSR